MKKFNLLISTCLLSALPAMAIVSPNGNIRVEHIDSVLSIDYRFIPADGTDSWQRVMNIVCDPVSETDNGAIIDIEYMMLTGKRSHCTNQYRQSEYTLPDGQQLTLRVFNDGVAWHVDAPTTVDVTMASNNWLQKWVDCYEEFFPKNRQTNQGDRWGYPALFEYGNGTFVLLSESNIDADCAASSMYNTADNGVYSLRIDGDGKYGWQTAIIGKLADIVESTLITDNSARSLVCDTSWIEPGVASWVYWAYNHGSNNYDIVKKYIDMAVDMRLPYVLIDAEWDEMKGEHTVEDCVRYANSKGVKPMIWYNSSIGWIDGAPGPKFRLNDPQDREREFAWCEELGIAGVKIDFFSGDNNRNIRYMSELLEDAAKHHLLVNFHGATIPRGWQRTYPNLISTEAVYGAEWYNNVPTFTDRAAAHNATLPFTRNVIGPMDYTPCAFSDSQHPHITSNAHELALTVLYESGIQHLADKPESFAAQPREVYEFFGTLPAAWDETLLLDGYPGDFVVMARRKGNKWYIAGINGNDVQRIVPINTTHLPNLTDITLYADGDSQWDISNLTTLPSTLTLHPRGGFVITAQVPHSVRTDHRSQL